MGRLCLVAAQRSVTSWCEKPVAHVGPGAPRAPLTAAPDGAAGFTACDHRLRDGVVCHDPGIDCFGLADTQKTTTRLVRRLQGLGYDVELNPAA